MICSRRVVAKAKMMRNSVAAAMPSMMALARCSRGNPDAAMPTTTALSPARTRSIQMMPRRALQR
jgi:hypothetical protein